MSQSFEEELIELLSAAPSHEPYSAMVKKRHASATHGINGGFAGYAATSPRRLSVSRLPFISAAAFARTSGARFSVLEPAGDEYTLQPAATIGENDAIPLHGRAREMYLTCIDDAVLESRSYIVRAGGVAIGDFEGSERERFDDCPELDAALFAVDGNEALVIDDHDAPKLDLDEAFVSLLGPHSPAFGHWIWHQLPRLIAALERGGLPDMPILIEPGMPPTHREALALVIGDRAMPIIELPYFGRAHVRRAWYAPMPFLMPYLPIPNDRWRWDYVAPSPARFEPILASMYESVRRLEDATSPRRVYLTRGKGLYRVLRNGAEIEAIFRRFGFTVVDPEKLTFSEQASLMASADFVAGPEGSALFLNFYRRSKTRLLILSHPFTRHLTNWTATLHARSIDTTIVTGPVVAVAEAELPPAVRFGYNYFVDYQIDAPGLLAVLDRLGR
jgi:capsular polysaccharide biosynthesis protein